MKKKAKEIILQRQVSRLRAINMMKISKIRISLEDSMVKKNMMRAS